MGHFFWCSVCISLLFVAAVSAGLFLLPRFSTERKKISSKCRVIIIPVKGHTEQLESLVKDAVYRCEQKDKRYCVVLFHNAPTTETTALSGCLCRKWKHVVCCSNVAELGAVFNDVLIANTGKL